jgi:hypothetical protein
MANTKLLSDEQLAEAARRLALAGALSESRLRQLVEGGQRKRLLRAIWAGKTALRAELHEPVMVYHEQRLWAVQLEPEVRAGLLSQLRDLARMTLVRIGRLDELGRTADVRQIGRSGEAFEELLNPYLPELVRLVNETEAQRSLIRVQKKEFRRRVEELEAYVQDLQLENAELMELISKKSRTPRRAPPVVGSPALRTSPAPEPETEKSSDQDSPPSVEHPDRLSDIQPDLFAEPGRPDDLLDREQG